MHTMRERQGDGQIVLNVETYRPWLKEGDARGSKRVDVIV